MDFLGGPVVKNLSFSAGDVGLIPGPGTKIPNAVEQQSPRNATGEESACHNKEPICRN